MLKLRAVLVSGPSGQLPTLYTKYNLLLPLEIAEHGIHLLQQKLHLIVPRLSGPHRVSLNMILMDLDAGPRFRGKIEWADLSLATAIGIHSTLDLSMQQLQSIAQND